MKRKEFEEKMEKLRFAKEQISPSDEDVEEWCRLQDAENASFPSEEGENAPADLEEWNSPEAVFSKPATTGHRPKLLRIVSMAAALALVVTAVAVTGYLASRGSSSAGTKESVTVGTEAEGSASAGTSDDTAKGEAAGNSDGENEGETNRDDDEEEQDFGNMASEVDGSSEEKVIISGYGDESDYLDMASGNFAAANGSVVYLDALCDAMDEYGDSVLYQVVVYLFQNGVANEDGIRTERKRLREGGYDAVSVSYLDENDVCKEWLMIYATVEQIREFDASDAYGYVLCLYDEGDIIW